MHADAMMLSHRVADTGGGTGEPFSAWRKKLNVAWDHLMEKALAVRGFCGRDKNLRS